MVFGLKWVASGAAPAFAAVIRHFRRVDPVQAYARTVAGKCITIDNIRALADNLLFRYIAGGLALIYKADAQDSNNREPYRQSAQKLLMLFHLFSACFGPLS